jgi:hypothetical protein
MGQQGMCRSKSLDFRRHRMRQEIRTVCFLSALPATSAVTADTPLAGLDGRAAPNAGAKKPRASKGLDAQSAASALA